MKEYVIYKAYDNKTKMIYIGMTKHFNKRKREHYNEHKRLTHFHRALKVRPNDFEWSVIETNLTFEEAKQREMYWISYFNSFYNGFNETLGGDGTQGLCGELNYFYGKHHTEETKKKIANRDYSHMYGATNPNADGKNGQYWKGKHLPDEVKKKMSVSQKKAWERKTEKELQAYKEMCSKRSSGKNNPMYGVKRNEENGWHLKEYITKTR